MTDMKNGSGSLGGRRAGKLLMILPFLLLGAGCSDGVRLPTAEEIAAFEAADRIVPEVDMERVNKAKLQTGPYRVVPGDVLEFTMPALLRAVTEADIKAAQMQQNKDYPFICRVGDDGTIVLPTVGGLDVVGKSLAEIEVKVVKAYEPYTQTRPSVYARVLEYQTSKVYIAGAIEKPGVYTLRADQMTLVSLLTEAGGISEAGAALVRVLASGTRAEVGEDANAPPLDNALSGTIAAPSSESAARSRAQQTATASASRVAGEATSSQSMTISSPSFGSPIHLSPSRRVTDAGHGEGPYHDELATFNKTNSQVLPETPGVPEGAEHGTISLPVVGMNIPFEDVSLAEGDTVVVEPVQMPLISVLGLVQRPGNFDYPPQARYNLAQAIALAGGLQMDVDPRYATVYRLQPNGAILRLSFRLIANGRYTEDLDLHIRPGDLITVEHTPRTRSNAFLNQVFRFNVGVYLRPDEQWWNND